MGSLLALLAAIPISAASTQWEARESFGARRLISTLPLLAIGLCECLHSLRSHGGSRQFGTAAAAATLRNWSPLTTYLITWGAERPADSGPPPSGDDRGASIGRQG